MFELHGKLQKVEKYHGVVYPLEAAISNFIILEVKNSEKGGYSVTFSIRMTCVFSCSTLKFGFKKGIKMVYHM